MRVILVSIFILIVSSCFRHEGYELVWHDEFNYIGLPDSTKWSYDTEGNSWQWGNNELQHYTSHNETNAWVQDDKLYITATKSGNPAQPYTSARIITKGKGEWQYGRIEVCAKVAGGQGAWPAIWMLPVRNEYGNWPASGEIDIMEYVGYQPDSIYCTVHTGAYNHTKNTQKSAAWHLADAQHEFHVYAIEWTEKSCKFFIDGHKCFVFHKEAKASSDQWPFDQPFYLILNVAVGGHWGGKYGIDESIFPSTMEIDYVRVYQKSKPHN
ncbi:glycoside hydrolase family 16 protein [Carboxylicivirga sediminis]|uniref:Glycoside hydrolase family 16 protein n=1 Tax=Carboxylicivirga sediminis TaxID=2006564 RepID=A0A941IWJ6_9BACT|nr:glycoside hydrolase family 16 protein [Carboxylicivirga sediminis]MBR8534464.1 glycoside hydrolase family 16 protein [Carboxylicivirga sediminis]